MSKTNSTPEENSSAPRRRSRRNNNISKTTEETPGCSNEAEGSTPSLRRSSRKRTSTFRVFTQTEVVKKAVHWNKAEKTSLLEGLRTVGDGSIPDLAKFVPTKMPFQVEYYVNSLKRKSQKIQHSDGGYALLDLWSRKIKYYTKSPDPSSFDSLPMGLLIMSLFEEFPIRQQASGIDFRTLYQYLFCLFAEQPLPKLDRKSKQFLRQSIKEIEIAVKNERQSLLEALFENYELTRWPYNSKEMNPLFFPALEMNLKEK